MRSLRGAAVRGMVHALIASAFVALVAGCGGRAPATASGRPASSNGADAAGYRQAGPPPTPDADIPGGPVPTIWSAEADPASRDSRPAKSDEAPISIDRGFSVTFPTASRPTALATKGGGPSTEVFRVDLATGERSNVLRPEESPPTVLAISPNGNLLAGRLSRADDHVRVWSFDTGRVAGDSIPPKALVPRASTIEILRFAGDDRLIAIRRAAHGGEAIVIEIGAAKPMQQIVLPSLVGRGVGVSPGGRYLAVLGEGRLFAYEIDSGTCRGGASFDRALLDDLFDCPELVFSPDGREVATILRIHGGDLRLLAWDFTAGELVRRKSLPADAWRRRYPNFVQQSDEQPLAWLPDGSGWVLYGRMIWQRDAEAPDENFPEPEDESVRRLVDARRVVTLATDAEGNKSLRWLSLDASASPNLATTSEPEATDANAWKVTSDPAAIRPAIGDRSLAIFGGPLGEPIFGKRPGSRAVIPVGDRYALVDLERGVETGRVAAGKSPAPTAHDISPDGRWVAIGDALTSDGSLSVRVLDATTGAEALAVDTAGGATIEFLDENRLLISTAVADSSARRYAVHDVRGGELTVQFETPREIGGQVPGSHAVSPGGRWLSFASDGRLRAFDLTTGKSAGDARIPLPPRIANVSAVRSPCFSLDGSRLLWLVEDFDGYRTMVWDMTTGQVVGEQAIDAAELSRAIGTPEDVKDSRSVPWRLDDADWLTHGQAAIDASTGKVVGPFGLGRPHATLPLDARRFLAVEVAIGPDDAATVLHSFAATESGVADAAIASLADLRPRPDIAAPPPRPPVDAPSVAGPAEAMAPEAIAAAEVDARRWEPTVDPPKDADVLSIAEEFEGPASNVNSFVVSEPAPAFVLEVDESDDLATLRDVRTGLIVGTPFEFAGEARLAAVRIDGGYVACGGDDATVVIHDVEKGVSLVYENDESFNYLRWLGFDGEGNVVAAYSDEDDLIQVHTLRVDREEVVREFGVARDDWDVRNAGFAISPGGNWLASIRIDGLTLYDLCDPTNRREAPMPYRNDASQHPILHCDAARFSPDGRHLAAVCRRLQHSFLVVWDLETGEPTTYRPYTRTFAQRAPRIDEQGPPLAWTPDGKALVWNSSLLIDPATGTPYWVVPNDDLVPIVHLSADRMLAVAQDGPGHELTVAPLPIGPIEKTRTEAYAAPSEATLKLDAVDPVAYRAPSSEPVAAAPAFKPDPTSGKLALAETIEIGPHGDGGRIPRFFLAPSGVAIVERQNVLETPNVGGPMLPERSARLEAYDLSDGELLGSVELPGRSRLLAVSPDGELALCGAPVGDFNFDEFGRLDVWWPKQKKHVLSWRPIPIESSIGEVVSWAAFADRRHVLTFGAGTLTSWELPTCRVVYRMPFGLHPPRMSPGGQRFVHPTQAAVRDSLTGAVVARLAGIGDGGKYLMLNDAAPDADGASVLGVASDRDQSFVVRWELPGGKVLEEHPIPRDVGGVSRIGDDRLRLRSMTFQDVLFSRSLASPTARLDIREYAFADGPDGSFWRVENARSVRLRKVQESDLPLPAKAPDVVAVPRGASIGVDVASNLPIAATLKTAMVDELERSGYRVEAGAAVRAKLTMNKIDRILRKGPPRDVVIPYVQGGIQIVAADGQTVWQDQLERMWEKPEDVDPAGWIESREIPSIVYRPDWGTRLEMMKVPALESAR